MGEQDFLKEIGPAGLHSRIKRLSDNLLYSTRDFYKAVGADIEPNWHLVFLLLQHHQTLTITEIAERLQLSHPAVVKIIRNMRQKGYVQAKTDLNDSRKQSLTLTEKAKSSFAQYEKYWDAGVLTTLQMLEDNPGFMEALTKLEEQISLKSYKDRTLDNLI